MLTKQLETEVIGTLFSIDSAVCSEVCAIKQTELYKEMEGMNYSEKLDYLQKVPEEKIHNLIIEHRQCYYNNYFRVNKLK